ncbi:Mf(Alpha)2p [Saccharomyces eubayanus]|uniref:Mf(Alpha)2p n=1 Tax=Saccharomyces eubayanus TaxID=1080349 RepID=UPI0006C02C52|nr:MF(ALPHA)2-like protein [Saccharomyces eubayanus]KOG99430.1 MF(ALPHA)2-like protein [Saccharomyces eubayanus]
MKLSSVISTIALAAVSVAAASSDDVAKVPAEAVIGYLDLGGDHDITVLPFSNSTASGLLFINTTIVDAAQREENSTLAKREAVADAWHWLKLRPGQPMYKRDAEANAEAEAWHWLQLRPGQPMYKREADAWHWLQLRPGQPMY